MPFLAILLKHFIFRHFSYSTFQRSHTLFRRSYATWLRPSVCTECTVAKR